MASKEGFDSEVVFNIDSGIATADSHERVVSSTPLSVGNTTGKMKDLTAWEQALRSEQERLDRENAELQQAWSSFRLAESGSKKRSETGKFSLPEKGREKSPAREKLFLQQSDTPAKIENTMVATGKSCVGMEITSNLQKGVASDHVNRSPCSDISMKANVSNSPVTNECEELLAPSSKVDNTVLELHSEPPCVRTKARVNDVDRISNKGAYRSRLVPERYSGSVSWDIYKVHFSIYCDMHGLNEKERKEYLLAMLTGPALQLLNSVDIGPLTYEQLCHRLDARFGSIGKRDICRLRLKQRQRLEGETLQSLAQDIRELVAIAYPETKGEMFEQLCIDAYFNAIDIPEIRRKVNEAARKRGCSFDDVIRESIHEENYLMLAGSLPGANAKKRTSVKSVGDGVPDKLSEIANAMVGLQQNIERLRSEITSLRTKSSSEGQRSGGSSQGKKKSRLCYQCNQPGHFRKFCPLNKLTDQLNLSGLGVRVDPQSK